jgi:hypothetical protein
MRNEGFTLPDWKTVGQAYTHRMIPWYPEAIAAETGALFLALTLLRTFRNWSFQIDIRLLIGFHLIRFVGVYFLYLYARQELPYSFAVWGGVGDIAVAALALFVIRFVNFRPGLIAWNFIGLADILGVAAIAARSGMQSPGSMHQLDKFPLILLPTLVVPLVIFTHVLMLMRAFRTATPPTCCSK